jgi:hypothetical protein
MIRLELQRLNEQSAESAQELRDLEAARLDELHRAHWPAAVGEDGQPPDPRAAALVLRIAQRRSELLGLDAPTRIETRNSSYSVEDVIVASKSLGIPLPYGFLDESQLIDQATVLPLPSPASEQSSREKGTAGAG